MKTYKIEITFDLEAADIHSAQQWADENVMRKISNNLRVSSQGLRVSEIKKTYTMYYEGMNGSGTEEVHAVDDRTAWEEAVRICTKKAEYNPNCAFQLKNEGGDIIQYLA